MNKQSESYDVRKETWTRYWSSGATQAFIASDVERAKPLFEFWKEFFKGIDKNSRVLDVGAGNGFLVKLALDSIKNSGSATFDAIDLADVSPRWLEDVPPATRNRIRFHTNTNAESIPFHDGYFDVVVSQYALEYMDAAKTIAELSRVTSPGAELAFLIHDENSLIVNQAREELSHMEWFVKKDFYLRAAKIAEVIACAVDDNLRAQLSMDSDANELRVQFNGLLREARERASGSRCPDAIYDTLYKSMQIIKTIGQGGVQKELVNGLFAIASTNEGMAVRLRELLACAKNESAVYSMFIGFPAFHEVSVRSINATSGETLGWAVRARRR